MNVHKYWESEHDIDYSVPKYNTRSELLVKVFRNLYKYPDYFSQHRILELGCNVGRNLHYLYNSGFTDLTGVDIREGWSNEMEVLYPAHVLEIMKIHGNIEGFLATQYNNSFDTIFTMGVLMHLQDIKKIATEMIRVVKNYILIFELTKIREDKQPYAWTYNYMDLFQDMEFIREINCNKEISSEYRGYLFMKKEVKN